MTKKYKIELSEDRKLFIKIRELVIQNNIKYIEDYNDLREIYDFLPENPKQKFGHWFLRKDYRWCRSKYSDEAKKEKIKLIRRQNPNNKFRNDSKNILYVEYKHLLIDAMDRKIFDLYSCLVTRHNERFRTTKYISFQRYKSLILKTCEYCGRGSSNKIMMDNGEMLLYNGIDRINSKVGYTLENSVTCCKYCNVMKHVLSKDDFLLQINKIYNYQMILNK